MGREALEQARDLERAPDPIGVTAGGDATLRGQRIEQVWDAGNRRELALERRQDPRPQGLLEGIRQPAAVLGLDRAEHRGRADAEKAVADRRLGDLDPGLAQGRCGDPGADRLAVDQHAVQIEDDEIEPAVRLAAHQLIQLPPSTLSVWATT